MHLITEEQRNCLTNLNQNKRQKEILKKEYHNGEWYTNDIRYVSGEQLPKAECWCAGFPCQDISVAGKQLGFDGNRSSLFFELIRLIKEQKQEDKPKYLFLENVKNLLSINKGWDFARILFEMDKIGYDAEWEVLNSKDFGVPQNRERVFIIGHLRGSSGRKIFPIERTTSQNYIKQIGMTKGKRENPNMYRTYGKSGISPTLCTNGGSNTPCLTSSMRTGGGYIQIQNYDSDYRIRKLTPKECFRLQGWTDEYFEKAYFINSNSQLYKQAGNGVTVNVIKAIGQKLGDSNGLDN